MPHPTQSFANPERMQPRHPVSQPESTLVVTRGMATNGKYERISECSSFCFHILFHPKWSLSLLLLLNLAPSLRRVGTMVLCLRLPFSPQYPHFLFLLYSVATLISSCLFPDVFSLKAASLLSPLRSSNRNQLPGNQLHSNPVPKPIP